MTNVSVIIGNLTKDPELKHTTSGIANVRFTLAVNRSFTNANGEKQTDFINCVAWRKTAENMATFLKKGSKISVTGRIETSNFEGADNKRVYLTTVVAENVDFLDPKNNQAGSSSQQSYQQQPQTQQSQQPRYQQEQQQPQYQQEQQQPQYQQQQPQYQQRQQQQPSYTGAGGGGQSNYGNNPNPNPYTVSDDDLPF